MSVRELSHFFRLSGEAKGVNDVVRAIDNVSLEVPTNHFLSIVGASGCGKTTLLNILAGLEPLQVGHVALHGAPPWAGSRQVAYMQSRDALLPWRTVTSNAGFGLEARGVAAAARAPIVQDLLERVGLGAFVEAKPRQLSQGMRQRVALARTFALDSSILLMDEPFGALDAQTKHQLQAVLLQLWERDRRTVVLVTHDLQEALALSDRVVVMSPRPGRIKAVYDVDLPRPRIVGELLTDARFMDLYKRLLHDVEGRTP